MKVFKTNFGKGIYLDDSELTALGFIAVNLLGETGIPMLDEYAERITPTLLSEYHYHVLENLLAAIRNYKETNDEWCSRK